VFATRTVADLALHICEHSRRFAKLITMLRAIPDDVANNTSGLVVAVPVQQCLERCSVRSSKPLLVFRLVTLCAHRGSDVSSLLSLHVPREEWQHICLGKSHSPNVVIETPELGAHRGIIGYSR